MKRDSFLLLTGHCAHRPGRSPTYPESRVNKNGRHSTGGTKVTGVTWKCP